MSETAQNPIILSAQLTRAGLNKLLDLDMSAGLKEVITHVSLTATAFTATDALVSIPDEIPSAGVQAPAADPNLARWPILDGERITGNQHNLYVEYPYTGSDTPIRGFGFHLSDGTLIAAYSSTQAEAYLSSRFLLDSFIHLVIDGVPTDSLEIINTGVRFNPGLREEMASIRASFIESLAQLLQQATLNTTPNMQQHDRLTALENPS